MLDILGFSSRVVAGDSESGGVNEYIDIVVKSFQPYTSKLKMILFSDTVILYTPDDSISDFENIIEVSSKISYSLIMAEVPFRGAISYGAFLRSEQEAHGTVIVGRPIVDAHHYESQLQWVGLMLTPSVLRQIPDIATRTVVSRKGADESAPTYLAGLQHAVRIQACSQIPIEALPDDQTSYLSGYAVVPLSDFYSIENIKENMSTVLHKLIWMKQLAPDPRSQAKYENSVTWLRKLYQHWLSVLR